MIGALLDLISVFSRLGIVAVGGVLSVLPEMQHQVVDVHHWMTAREFASMFALAQAAPGPNVMVVALVGWKVAGLAGAVLAMTALIAPPGMVVLAAGRIWQRFHNRTWLRDVQAGLSAVTVGLVAAAALILAEASAEGWRAGVLVVIAAALLTLTRIHPLWVLAAGAVLGGLGWI